MTCAEHHSQFEIESLYCDVQKSKHVGYGKRKMQRRSWRHGDVEPVAKIHNVHRRSQTRFDSNFLQRFPYFEHQTPVPFVYIMNSKEIGRHPAFHIVVGEFPHQITVTQVVQGWVQFDGHWVRLKNENLQEESPVFNNPEITTSPIVRYHIEVALRLVWVLHPQTPVLAPRITGGVFWSGVVAPIETAQMHG